MKTEFNYLNECLRTLNDNHIMQRANLVRNNQILDLLHATIGLSTESGELLDTLKKHIFYNDDIDITNIIEELGDICWYISIAIHSLNQYGVNIDLENIQKRNISKLKARYPEKFTTEKAIHRNLENERNILEKGDTENE